MQPSLELSTAKPSRPPSVQPANRQPPAARPGSAGCCLAPLCGPGPLRRPTAACPPAASGGGGLGGSGLRVVVTLVESQEAWIRLGRSDDSEKNATTHRSTVVHSIPHALHCPAACTALRFRLLAVRQRAGAQRPAGSRSWVGTASGQHTEAALRMCVHRRWQPSSTENSRWGKSLAVPHLRCAEAAAAPTGPSGVMKWADRCVKPLQLELHRSFVLHSDRGSL